MEISFKSLEYVWWQLLKLINLMSSSHLLWWAVVSSMPQNIPSSEHDGSFLVCCELHEYQLEQWMDFGGNHWNMKYEITRIWTKIPIYLLLFELIVRLLPPVIAGLKTACCWIRCTSCCNCCSVVSESSCDLWLKLTLAELVSVEFVM